VTSPRRAAAGDRAGLAHQDCARDGPVAGGNPIRRSILKPARPQDTNDLGSTRCGLPGTRILEGTSIDPPSFLDYFQGFLQASQIVDRFHQNCDGSDPYVPEDAQGTLRVRGPHRDRRHLDVRHGGRGETCSRCSRTSLTTTAHGRAALREHPDGDVIYVNQAARVSESENAVHIEATARSTSSRHGPAGDFLPPASTTAIRT